LRHSLTAFFELAVTNISKVLGYEPANALALVNHELLPGRQIQVYPPFVLDIGDGSRSYRPVPSLELRDMLAQLAATIRNLPDGTRVEFKFTD
jgi:hypothetical protein